MSEPIIRQVAGAAPYVEDFVPTVDIFGYPERIVLAGVLVFLAVLFFVHRAQHRLFKYVSFALAAAVLLYFAVLVWLAV